MGDKKFIVNNGQAKLVDVQKRDNESDALVRKVLDAVENLIAEPLDKGLDVELARRIANIRVSFSFVTINYTGRH